MNEDEKCRIHKGKIYSLYPDDDICGECAMKELIHTLPKDVIEWIDLQVSEGRFPSRSYGIEHGIKFTMKNKK